MARREPPWRRGPGGYHGRNRAGSPLPPRYGRWCQLDQVGLGDAGGLIGCGPSPNRRLAGARFCDPAVDRLSGAGDVGVVTATTTICITPVGHCVIRIDNFGDRCRGQHLALVGHNTPLYRAVPVREQWSGVPVRSARPRNRRTPTLATVAVSRCKGPSAIVGLPVCDSRCGEVDRRGQLKSCNLGAGSDWKTERRWSVPLVRDTGSIYVHVATFSTASSGSAYTRSAAARLFDGASACYHRSGRRSLSSAQL